MKNFDLSLYLVLDANLCVSPQGMLNTTLDAVIGGCTFVQLRAPEWKKRMILETAVLIKRALSEFPKVKFVVDDHVDIALLSGADGVHLGQKDISVRAARHLMGKEAIIGLSIGSIEEIKTITDEVDYIGIGPIFSTQTKKDAGPPLGLGGLQEISERTKNIPKVAIGGINQNNTKEVLLSGADGIAVVSAICADTNPYEATKKLKEIICSVKSSF